MNKDMIGKMLIVFLVFLGLSSCHNKEICPECEKESVIKIQFNWDKVTNIPEGMTVLFYNMQNQLIYTFNNVSPDGQLIRIDAGTYKVACYNNDTEYVEWTGENNLDSLHVSTRKTDVLKSNLKVTNEDLVESPDFLCGSLLPEKEILAYVFYNQIVLLEPEPLLDYYSYSVSNIENGQYIIKTMATLSGMSKDYYMADTQHRFNNITMTFGNNELINSDNTAIGNMFNFGRFSDTYVKNYLTLYIWSPGGNLRATFDVTNQVRNAPDPHNVHIVIDTKIIVAPPIEGGDGINPSVDEWKDIIYDVIL